MNNGKQATTPILSLVLQDEIGVVEARQRARQLAAKIGFGTQDQVRIATAVSEISRNAFRYAGGGRVEFAFSFPKPQALCVRVVDRGPGISDLDSVLEERYRSSTGLGIGIVGTRQLMDRFDLSSSPAGTTVSFAKYLPPSAPLFTLPDLQKLALTLTAARPASPADEVYFQNHEIMEVLESLRRRELELEKRESDLRRINSELEETNRGVVALYAELDEKAAALRDANELKGRFLSHVSHEFRTPLNSILALTQLLHRRADGELTVEQERQVGYIRKAAQDLTEIVNDLLDLAKVESGKTEVNLTTIEVAQLFGVLRGMMRPLATNDSVIVAFDEPAEKLTFESDESKISQILRNLISNALKFTERGEVRVWSEIEQDLIRFRVADTGIGIAPADQERIFLEFSQIQSPIQKRVKGTGLGLPLSRKLALLLGGTLEVESEPGQGSTFTLTLPHGSAKLDEDRTGEASESILIIDDEEPARYILRHHLRGTHRPILEATGGIEGAERARFEHPALIFLDLIMPDRNGFEVLDELKADPATRDIPVIIHSSRRLKPADFERLGGRQAGILPKGDRPPSAVVQYVRELLGEPDIFDGDTDAKRPQ